MEIFRAEKIATVVDQASKNLPFLRSKTRGMLEQWLFLTLGLSSTCSNAGAVSAFGPTRQDGD